MNFGLFKLNSLISKRRQYFTLYANENKKVKIDEIEDFNSNVFSSAVVHLSTSSHWLSARFRYNWNLIDSLVFFLLSAHSNRCSWCVALFYSLDAINLSLFFRVFYFSPSSCTLARQPTNQPVRQHRSALLVTGFHFIFESVFFFLSRCCSTVIKIKIKCMAHKDEAKEFTQRSKLSSKFIYASGLLSELKKIMHGVMNTTKLIWKEREKKASKTISWICF